MSELKMAPGREAGAQLGASVSIKERDKIAQLVELSVKGGAKVETGGVMPEGPGAFYPPTVLTVDKSNEILKYEVFGPVAPIVTFETDDEAITLANDSATSIQANLVAQSALQKQSTLEWWRSIAA
jgi:succinate-semialdehyde dehydrogenase/glutarate-semialdehyde dehydrogenase